MVQCSLALLLFGLTGIGQLYAQSAVNGTTPTGSGAWLVGGLLWTTILAVIALILWLYFSSGHHSGKT